MQRPRKSKAKFYRSVFRRVMSRYEEYRLSDRYIYSSEQFYSSLAEEGVNGGKWNTRIVKVTPSDFMADVELSALRVLTAPIHRLLFKEVYVRGNEEYLETLQKRMTEEVFLDLKHAVQEIAGAAFKACKLHPAERYFKPRDTR